MKKILILFLLFSFFNTFGQKKYVVKIRTLDNKVFMGIFNSVDEKGIYVIPKNTSVSNKNSFGDKTQFLSFEKIKDIKLRKKGSAAKGFLIGLGAGIVSSVVVLKIMSADKSNKGLDGALNGFATGISIMLGSPIVGCIIGGTFPYQFTVKKDSNSIHELTKELKKYELNHLE